MSTASTLRALRTFARPVPRAERCELCNAALAPELHHEHLFEVATRQLRCACASCAFLLGSSADATYRKVPARAVALPGFSIGDADWQALGIPIELAFLFERSGVGPCAIYPSPAGPTEAPLPASAWQALRAGDPRLAAMQPDVEALLVHRKRSACVIAPISECFRLVGLLRARWNGIGGGDDVWQLVDDFVAALETPRA